MTDEQVKTLADAVGRIASGDERPDGLEAVAIALGGHGLKHSVAGAILELATAVHALADAVRGER
jgi:hypothetical protein